MAHLNPYQAPSASDEEPRSDPRRNWKWLLFSTEGRIPRGKYWLGSVVAFGTMIVPWMVLGALTDDSLRNDFEVAPFFYPVLVIVAAVVMIVCLWMSLALSIKRWHDRGKSGAWVLIGLIPYIGGIWSFVELGCLAGDRGRNKYGPPFRTP